MDIKIVQQREYNSSVIQERRKRKDIHLCTRRHQRRIIQAKTQHECHIENNFGHSVEHQLNIKVDTNSNNASSTFESNETVDNDFDEMFDKSNTSCRDFEQYKVSNEILNSDNYESPSNLSDKCDDKSINNDENDTIHTLNADLTQWALKYAIHHNAINDLLPIISKYIPNCSLPRDARTLLHTPRETNVVNLAGGQYVHLGLMPALHSIMQEIENAGLSVNNINLSLNIDGLPISRSSTNSFWPILISGNIFRTVKVIGVYYGQKKPTSANEYLRKFVDELKSAIDNGFIYKNKLIKIRLSTIICDTPAKSFILNIKGHTGFSSCTKCMIDGQSVNKTTCFPYEDLPSRARTDEDFIRQSDEEYHRGRTILTEIPNIGLVTNVTLDYMHLVCLGVVKKLILLWIKGPLSVRIGNNNIIKCSRYMVSLHDTIPSEFSRKPRALTDNSNWKATEFRQFLLYTGPIVLQSILKKHIYVHFLSLHVALSILVSPSLVKETSNIKYAEDLLKYFVQNFQTLYGVQFMSHNVHNLLHLCGEVRKFGSVDNFSAFPFENFMIQIKKMLRKFEKPLQQLARRYGEQKITSAQSINFSFLDTLSLKKKHHDGPVLLNAGNIDQLQYKILKTNSFYFNCDDKRDNCFLLKDNSVIIGLNIVQLQNNDVYIIGRKCKILKGLYDEPCSSKLLDIYIIRDVINSALSWWPVSSINNKMWRVQLAEIDYVIPIRHVAYN